MRGHGPSGWNAARIPAVKECCAPGSVSRLSHDRPTSHRAEYGEHWEADVCGETGAVAVRHLRIAALSVLFALAQAPALGEDLRDPFSDTWTATDVLGRTLPAYEQAGPPRTGPVGLFYSLWFGQHGTGGPYDIAKLLAANPTNRAWGPAGAFHHWGEPELGYYLPSDRYVMRMHAHAITDAAGTNRPADPACAG